MDNQNWNFRRNFYGILVSDQWKSMENWWKCVDKTGIPVF
jgi:hypothetical protein